MTAKARVLLASSAEHAAAEVDASEAPPQPGRSQAAYTEVPVSSVAPNAYNVRADLGDMEEITRSVAERGVLQPLIVRPVTDTDRDEYPAGTRYIVVMGHRRLEALRQAGLELAPVVVRTDIDPANERQAMLIENLQREDLSPIEEARAFQELLETGLSQRTLAKQLGVTQPHISRRLGLLGLDDDLQDLITAGRLGVDVATSHLAKLPAAEQASVVDQLRAEEERHGSPGLVWDAETVRAAADEAAREALIEQIHADQEADAAAAGAEIIDWPTARERFGDRVWSRALHSRDDIVRVAEAGDLLAIITDRRQGPDYYTAGKIAAAKPAGTLDREAEERKAWTATKNAVTAWVTSYGKPTKAELHTKLCAYVVERAHKDEGAQALKWLRGQVGADTEDYYTWQDSLTETDYPVVAWHIMVAADLYASRYSPKGAASARTRARVEEVQR